MVDTHFTSLISPPQDNPTGHNEADNVINSGDDRTNTTLNSDLDRIFSPKRMKKSLAEFDPLLAAGPDGIRPVMLQKVRETINAAYTNIAKASYLSHSTGETQQVSSFLNQERENIITLSHTELYHYLRYRSSGWSD